MTNDPLNNKACKLVFLAMLMLNIYCSPAADPADEISSVVVTPVEVTTTQIAPLSEYIELTAVSSYPRKSYIKAGINGYVQSVNASVGQHVSSGMLLFRLITKEARAIGNGINDLDPSLKFSGISSLRADQTGFVTVVNHQTGDYVQDGEPMAVITNQSSLIFLLDLPYELNGMIQMNKRVKITLPDGLQINGTIGNTLPSVDSLAQTKRLIIIVDDNAVIPEGLVAKVQLVKNFKPAAQTLPKSTVLANETEDKFWVMKLINDSTAIKIPVIKGISYGQRVEVISPIFSKNDRIIVVGNYGIPDTARVKIVKGFKP
ncbi:MAG: HlyD family efflux transporter periplasmic adaptor subunit [Pedobacter sp.]|nr:HlyD family efflux transporter periplasmic adaptor subunit [Pedobacter sp.]